MIADDKNKNIAPLDKVRPIALECSASIAYSCAYCCQDANDGGTYCECAHSGNGYEQCYCEAKLEKGVEVVRFEAKDKIGKGKAKDMIADDKNKNIAALGKAKDMIADDKNKNIAPLDKVKPLSLQCSAYSAYSCSYCCTQAGDGGMYCECEHAGNMHDYCQCDSAQVSSLDAEEQPF